MYYISCLYYHSGNNCDIFYTTVDLKIFHTNIANVPQVIRQIQWPSTYNQMGWSERFFNICQRNVQ